MASIIEEPTWLPWQKCPPLCDGSLSFKIIAQPFRSEKGRSFYKFLVTRLMSSPNGKFSWHLGQMINKKVGILKRQIGAQETTFIILDREFIRLRVWLWTEPNRHSSVNFIGGADILDKRKMKKLVFSNARLARKKPPTFIIFDHEFIRFRVWLDRAESTQMKVLASFFVDN